MRAILTFHSVDEKDSVISYHPQYFSQLLGELDARNIPVMTLDTLLDPQTRQGVAITFDDGMKSVCTNALPVIRDHGVSAHMFLATGVIGEEPWPRQAGGEPTFEMLDWSEIEKLHDAGVLVESHTHSHPDMRTLTSEQIEEECTKADELIEKRLGRRPDYFAYPFGYHNKKVRDLVRPRYKATVTTELRRLGSEEDNAALPRLDTYYLQSGVYIRNIDSPLLRGYLAVRNILRTWKGSQCTVGCD